MAKKVRKPRASSPRTYSQSTSSATLPPAAPAQSAKTTPARKSSTAAEPQVVKQVDLATEYAVVGSDLRRLLVTAAIMFVVLIAINLVLTFVI